MDDETHAAAIAWLDAELAASAMERTGPVAVVQARPWATVLRAPTRHGDVFLKASGGETAFEPALYRLLFALAPDRVLEPLAIDERRGWTLLPDGGPPLGRRLEGAALADALGSAFAAYGELQRELAPHVGRLLAMGIADMRPAAMPARFEQALAAVGGGLERDGTPADRDLLRRVAALDDRVAEWCEHLAASPGGASLDHNDLHADNVLAGPHGSVDGGARFYDWGDAVVAHPFASMLVGLTFAREHVLRTGPGDPRVDRLRDAYLEPFGDFAPHAELVETLELACHVAKVARALIWHRATRDAPSGDDWRRAPLHSLAALLDDDHLGGA